MEKNKIFAIATVVVVIAAGIGIYAMMGNNHEAEKKGLYKLDAKVANVNMGQCSATPGVIDTLEALYGIYYGEIVDKNLTIQDAKNNTAFWNTYCKWTSMVTKNENSKLTIKIDTKAKGAETVVVPVSKTMVTMGTMYSETLYYLICSENNVKPYSDASFENANVKQYLQRTISGGMSYSYYSSEDIKYILKCVPESGYGDVGTTTVQKIDPEKLTQVLENAKKKVGDVVYLASGTRIATEEHYNTNTNPCKTAGVAYAYFSPSTIPEVFSSIECIGLIMGFDKVTIDKVIEDIQLRLYKVYDSVEKKTAGKTQKDKVYWEGNSGKAVKSSMASIIMGYLGFDTTLLDGAEHDLEGLLKDKPKMVVFYTNDGRTDAEKMRTNI